MLDEQHGDLALVADAPDEAAELADLLVIEPASRLVEQQQLRACGERARQLDPLARAERQTFGRLVRHFAQIECFEQRPGGLFEPPLLAAHPWQPQRIADKIAAAGRVGADPHIVEHRLTREQRKVLKGPGNADLGDAVRRPVEQRAALEQDFAAVGRVEAAEAIEQCRLAGAVGADQAEDLALFQLERDAVERDDAAEPHRDIANLEQRGAAHPSSLEAVLHRPCRPHPR